MVNKNIKISATHTLKDAIIFYKRNFLKLTFISLLGFIISVFTGIFEIVWENKYMINLILVSIISGMGLVWMQIMLTKTIICLYSDKDSSLKDIIISPIGRFWRTLWVNIGYYCMLIGPLFIASIFNSIAVLQSPEQRLLTEVLTHGKNNFHQYDPIIACVVYLIALIPVLKWAVTYIFASISAIFEEKDIPSFSNSQVIIGKNFWHLFGGLIIVIGLIQFVPIILSILNEVFWKGMILNNKFIFTIGLSIYGFFSFPLQSVFLTLLFLKYRNNYVEKINKPKMPIEPVV